MSASTYLAAAAALGAASEATGTTAFTPLGEQARDGGRGGGIPTPTPGAGSGVDLSGLFEGLDLPESSTEVQIDLAKAGAGAAGAAGAGGENPLAGLTEQLLEQNSELADQLEEQRAKAEEVTETATDTTGSAADVATSIEEIVAATTGDGPTFDAGDTGSGGSSFLDKTERAGGQAKSAGSTLKETATEGGATIREAGKLLATGEADVSGTWDARADSENTEVRRGTVSGYVKDRIPSGSGSGSSGPTLEEKAAANVKDKLSLDDDQDDDDDLLKGRSLSSIRGSL